MKRISVGDGIYKSDLGDYYFRPWINGRRTWRKLAARNKNLALEEARARHTDFDRGDILRVEHIRAAAAPTIEGTPKPLEGYLDKLQEVHLPPVQSGAVYFLLQGDEVVYVGQSKASVYCRLFSHFRDKIFDRVLILPTPVLAIDEQERHFISVFCPRYNTTHIPKRGGKTQIFWDSSVDYPTFTGKPRKPRRLQTTGTEQLN